jgi:hypothetical protein
MKSKLIVVAALAVLTAVGQAADDVLRARKVFKDPPLPKAVMNVQEPKKLDPEDSKSLSESANMTLSKLREALAIAETRAKESKTGEPDKADDGSASLPGPKEPAISPQSSAGDEVVKHLQAAIDAMNEVLKIAEVTNQEKNPAFEERIKQAKEAASSASEAAEKQYGKGKRDYQPGEKHDDKRSIARAKTSLFLNKFVWAKELIWQTWLIAIIRQDLAGGEKAKADVRSRMLSLENVRLSLRGYAYDEAREEDNIESYAKFLEIEEFLKKLKERGEALSRAAKKALEEDARIRESLKRPVQPGANEGAHRNKEANSFIKAKYEVEKAYFRNVEGSLACDLARDAYNEASAVLAAVQAVKDQAQTVADELQAAFNKAKEDFEKADKALKDAKAAVVAAKEKVRLKDLEHSAAKAATAQALESLAQAMQNQATCEQIREKQFAYGQAQVEEIASLNALSDAKTELDEKRQDEVKATEQVSNHNRYLLNAYTVLKEASLELAVAQQALDAAQQERDDAYQAMQAACGVHTS